MFDIMFMLQKRNESCHTDSLSARITVQTGARTSSREQMRLLSHVITKQCCEIQSVGARSTLSSIAQNGQCMTTKYRESHFDVLH